MNKKCLLLFPLLLLSSCSNYIKHGTFDLVELSNKSPSYYYYACDNQINDKTFKETASLGFYQDNVFSFNYSNKYYDDSTNSYIRESKSSFGVNLNDDYCFVSSISDGGLSTNEGIIYDDNSLIDYSLVAKEAYLSFEKAQNIYSSLSAVESFDMSQDSQYAYYHYQGDLCGYVDCEFNFTILKNPNTLRALIIIDKNNKSVYESYTYIYADELSTYGAGTPSIDPYEFAFQTNKESFSIDSTMTKIGSKAFKNCVNLKTLNVNNFTGSFKNDSFVDSNIENINVSGENLSYSSINGVLFNKQGNILYCYPTNKVGSLLKLENILAINDFALYGSKLNDVVIPSSCLVIGEKSFEQMTNLQNIYYEGDEASFDNIDGNDNVNKTLVKYYSETPLAGYWHYGESGEPELY